MSDKPEIRKGFLPARKQFKYRGQHCLNCDQPLDTSDKYCPNCGQLNSVKKVTITDLLDEFFGSLISYDSKLRQTLKALLWKPGKITTEYISGKRASYTNPFRFLLSLCIIYFLMVGYTSNLEKLNEKSTNQISFTPDELNEAENILDSLDTKGIITTGAQNPARKREILDSLTQAIDTMKTSANFLAELNHEKDSLIKADPVGFYSKVKSDTSSATERFVKLSDFYYRAIQQEHFAHAEEAEKFLSTQLKGSELWAFRTGKSIYRVSREPGSFLNTTISRLPFFIFFFLPIFAVFIWLLYIRGSHTYMDHLIFSFHCQSLFIILLMFAAIIEWFTDLDLNWIAVVLFCFYLYMAMRAFYRQGHLKTMVKFFILNTIFVILASISTIIFLSGSALTY